MSTPTIGRMRWELMGIAEGVKAGGNDAFDEVCLRTLLYVIDGLAEIEAREAMEAQTSGFRRFLRWVGKKL